MQLSSDILLLIVEFCEHYLEEKMTELVPPLKRELDDIVQEWYVNFLKSKKVHENIFHLMMACNYLDIKPLLDLVSAYIVSGCKGKSVKEIREYYGIQSTQTEEDDAKLLEKCDWCELKDGEL